MASLRTSSLLLPHSSSSSSSSLNSNKRMSGATIMQLSTTESIKTRLMKELIVRNNNYAATQGRRHRGMESEQKQKQQMYLILEEIADRIEMHTNIGKQRENWNSLLLNSINMMTLTGVVLSSSAAATATTTATAGTVILFGAATGMLLIMNKIQPSQLAEEQRNAVRLLKVLKTEIESKLFSSNNNPCSKSQVDEMMKKVLALDRAYPLPLLGKMLEKFPKKLQPAVWWPQRVQHQQEFGNEYWCNGWSEELEVEMRAVAHILKTKDEADYVRLGNIALNMNKVLAVSGPLLTGFAAAAANTHAPALAAVAGAMAVAVNTFQHAGQVGMVVEMYRNCAGFFRMMEESIESTLDECDLEKRENGELFERKVALKLGRSLSQLRHLAATLSSSNNQVDDEFGSKLF